MKINSICAENISIEFPIYGTSSRSFKKSLINTATGGVFAKDSSDFVTVKALDNISFEIKEGDRVGLVGHNGSGKSTLLRVIAGIYEPTQGKLITNGKISSMLSLVLGIDMEATGLENIYMRGYAMGESSASMKSRIEEILDFSGIGEYINLPMRTYSSGMVMRLAFAITTSIDADIILMDEWLSVGDEDFIKKAEERLDLLVRKAKILVIASHNLQLIESKCNKVIKLEHGKMIQSV
jgi:lipopolysaccharide transport system ATP-binding protein